MGWILTPWPPKRRHRYFLQDLWKLGLPGYLVPRECTGIRPDRERPRLSIMRPSGGLSTTLACHTMDGGLVASRLVRHWLPGHQVSEHEASLHTAVGGRSPTFGLLC